MATVDSNIRLQKARNQKLIEKGEKPIVFDLIDGTDYEELRNDRPSATCSICGKEFLQDFQKKTGKYSSYKTCKACKKKGVTEDTTYIESLLYSPFNWQKEFHKAVATHKVVTLACGARTGKDYACVMEIIWQIQQLANECRPITNPEMVPSFVIWIVGPNERILEQNWSQIKKFMPRAFLPKGDRSIKDSEMKMELIQGGLLEVRSAYDADMLVGKAVDFCVITEAARINKFEDVWVNIEARLMSPGAGVGGKGGKVVLNSSPLGKNYFYKIFTWGIKNHPMYDSQYKSFQLSTDENPLVKKEMDEEVKGFNGVTLTRREQLRRRWGERKFRQDYLGEFLESGGTVFPNFRQDCVYSLFKEHSDLTRNERNILHKEMTEPIVGNNYRIGYDPASGSSGDSPIIIIRNKTTNQIVRAIDLYGKIDDAQLNAVAYWSKYYNYAEVCVLTTGNLLVEGQLVKRGIPVIPLGEQGQKKATLVQSLQVAVQNKDVQVVDDGSAEIETLIFQMEDYTEKNGKFSNETEEHDDYVSALYAVYFDYSAVPEIKNHYFGKIKSIRRKIGYKRR